MKPARRACLALALAAAALAGCEPGTQAPRAADNALSYEQTSKLSGYTRTLLGFDLVRLKAEYAERDLANAKPGDTPFIDDGSLTHALDELRRVRASDGALPGIDPLADPLIAALARLETRAKALSSYFTMRSYLDDGFARARAEHPQLLADYDAAIAAARPLAAAVEQAQAAHEQAALPRLKAEGRMAAYHDIEIAAQARALRRAIDSVAALDDPARTAAADRIVASLPPLLDRARAARATETAKGGENAPLDNGVIPSAEQMVGSYRELRQSKKPDDLSRMRQAAESILLVTA